MRWLHRELRRLRDAGEPVVTATVTDVRGSTPRGAGARMLVRGDGTIAGSVGGGCGEEQVRREALHVLDDGRSRLMAIDLTGEMSPDSATHCGGIMEVFLDRLAWQERPRVGLGAAEALDAIDGEIDERRAPVVLAVVAGGGGEALPAGARWVIAGQPGEAGPALRLTGRLPVDEGFGSLLEQVAADALTDGRMRRLGARLAEGRWIATTEPGHVDLLVEAIAPVPELIVVGAGHIAVPLVALGRLLDFEVTVIDDREDFATRSRFPDAESVLVGPVDETLRRRRIGPDTYIVLVTRDHQHDEAALGAVLGTPAAYVGMIGSRRRVREVFRRLGDAGVPVARLDRVHAPVGLAIGAETPAEIATAIAAELVQVRRAGRARDSGGRQGEGA